MDFNMQKPPNSLIIWKMFGECLISVHLLILFLCFSLENNNSKFSYTKYIIRVISILSPIGLYITYFFTFCIAQNLYCTFHYYKNDFEIRMQKYKTLAISMGIIVIIFSIILNKNIDYNNNYNTNNNNNDNEDDDEDNSFKNENFENNEEEINT
jgi:cytochrome c biogenesis factor